MRGEGGKNMTTRADVVDIAGGPAALTGMEVAKDLGRLLGLAFVLALAVGLLLTAAAVALPAPVQESEREAAPERATSGSFLMRRTKDEGWVNAPTLATEVSFRVAGVVARATVRQHFRNATDGWVEGVYVFPLSETAAVDHILTVGPQVEAARLPREVVYVIDTSRSRPTPATRG
jgi:hypothetical protein